MRLLMRFQIRRKMVQCLTEGRGSAYDEAASEQGCLSLFLAQGTPAIFAALCAFALSLPRPHPQRPSWRAWLPGVGHHFPFL